MTAVKGRGNRSRTRTGQAHSVKVCDTCGKHCYASRREARARAKAVYPGDHLSAYRCGGMWHLGHLPRLVITGDIERADLR